MISALLIGYGKTGKRIAHHAPKYTIGISGVVDHSCTIDAVPETSNVYQELTKEAIDSCDVAIDFSSSDAILSRITLFAEAKKPLIIGTTGWYSQMNEAKAIIEHHNGSLLWAPNFSLGVALYLHLAKKASQLMTNFSQYDVGIIETHHREKRDAPSGTAKILAEKVIEHYPDKKLCYHLPTTKALLPEQIAVTSHRVGQVPGTHEVHFDSAEDTISLTHTARSRDGFAKGALEASYWLIDKKGFYTLDDMIEEKLR